MKRLVAGQEMKSGTDDTFVRGAGAPIRVPRGTGGGGDGAGVKIATGVISTSDPGAGVKS